MTVARGPRMVCGVCVSVCECVPVHVGDPGFWKICEPVTVSGYGGVGGGVVRGTVSHCEAGLYPTERWGCIPL